MSRFLSQKLLSLKPYVPGEQPRDKKYIKLNTNESPYPPSPKVVSAINSEEIKDLRLYSDPDLKVLTETIADYFGVNKMFLKKLQATGFRNLKSLSLEFSENVNIIFRLL